MGTLNGFWPKCEDVILGFHYQDAKSCGHSTTHIGSKAGGPMWTTHLLFGWYPILASGNQTWLENPRTKCEFLADHVPVVPARGGAEVALGIYIYIYIRPFSSIELACAVRQPSPCVHAFFESGVLFHMSHLKLHFALHASHSTLHTPHFTLHTPHFTVHTSHFTLHTSHFTVHTSHFTVHTSHSTLHTALFTPHTSHCTLHTPHFISSELFSPYPSSSLLISSLLICHLSFHESLPSTNTKELACAVRQPGPCVRALCEAVAVLLSKNMTCARPRYNANTFLTLHIAFFTPHTPHFTLALHLNSSHLSSSHLIPCLPICQLCSSWLFSCQVLPSTDVYYKSLQKPLPSTTLYYKACTKHVPVLLCTTKLAQNTSQYYFVLQSLHKALPRTTLYYKACTKHVPALLCTTKLAQNTSQYYFVLQSLHKALPSTTVYYKACTNYFPVLLWPSNLDAATTMQSAETELQNTKEPRATASEIAAPKPDLDAKAEKRRFCSTF